MDGTEQVYWVGIVVVASSSEVGHCVLNELNKKLAAKAVALNIEAGLTPPQRTFLEMVRKIDRHV